MGKMTTAEQVKAAIDAGAWGSDYAAPHIETVEDRTIVVVTHRGRHAGYVRVRGETWDLSDVRLHSAARGKADGWLRDEIARLAPTGPTGDSATPLPAPPPTGHGHRSGRAAVCPRCLDIEPGTPGGTPETPHPGPFTDGLCGACERAGRPAGGAS